jgi:hypothetical protein
MENEAELRVNEMSELFYRLPGIFGESIPPREFSTFYAKLGGYQLIIDGLRRFRIPYLV